jgi:hypothetical protein
MANISQQFNIENRPRYDEELEIPHERWREHLGLVLGQYIRRYVANVDATDLMVECMEQVTIGSHFWI